MYIKQRYVTSLLPTFGPLFVSKVEASHFLGLCVGERSDLDPEEEPPFLHPRAQWLARKICGLVALADRTSDVELKFLVLVATVESTAKFALGYEGEGLSRAYCKKFFTQFCPRSCMSVLVHAFGRGGPDHGYQQLDYAFSRFYERRCVNIHRGVLLKSPPARAGFDDYDGLRHIVLTGCIAALRRVFEQDCPHTDCPGHDLGRIACDGDVCSFLQSAQVTQYFDPKFG